MKGIIYPLIFNEICYLDRNKLRNYFTLINLIQLPMVGLFWFILNPILKLLK